MWKQLLAKFFAPVEAPTPAKAQIRTKRKLPEIYRDELEKLQRLEAQSLDGLTESQRQRAMQTLKTQRARVAMYRERLTYKAL